MDSARWSACEDFLATARKTPASVALTVEGRDYSYCELAEAANAIAGRISANCSVQDIPRAAIYAGRNFETFASVLGALISGFTYVPLNPKFPVHRNATIVALSEASVLLGSSKDGGIVAEIAAESGTNPRLVESTIMPGGRAVPQNLFPVPPRSPYAYIMFTSGSTGAPKGVPIRHSNLSAYLDAVFEVADYGADDRMSQNFDLTFDLSVHDMFVCWRAGARLVVPSLEDLERPADYIKSHRITCWFSVPTLGQKLLLQGALTENAFLDMRLSLFCGEALPTDLGLAWQRATGQRVENWYGPTEATISCMRYVLPDRSGPTKEAPSLVPIGVAFPGTDVLVANDNLQPAKEGEPGELLLVGPQLADGYLNSPEKTSAAFVIPPGRQRIHYRTGDRVVMDDDGQIHFIGRTDNQIKIRGYRVELGEIEAALRSKSGGHAAIVVPLPLNSPTPVALAAAVEAWVGDAKQLLAALADGLPDYMIPSRIVAVAQFPRNASGKVDRAGVSKVLVELLDEEHSPKVARGKAASAARQGGKRRQRLIRIIQKINPSLSAEQITTAENLMDAGLDSIGFVNFTAELEKKFGLPMDQGTANELSYLSLKQIARHIARHRMQLRQETSAGRIGIGKAKLKHPPADNAATSSARKRKKANVLDTVHIRAHRALDFVDAFPQLVASTDKPLAIFIGSSGFYRGISAAVAEARAAECGIEIVAANAGIAALNAEGLAQLAEFVRDCLVKAGKRLAFGVTELDPMHLSVLPPKGDLELINQYLAGQVRKGDGPVDLDKNGWDLQTRGTMASPGKTQQRVEPNWTRARNLEVRNMYVGELDLNEDAVASWIRGATALADVSEHSFAVMHPLNDPTVLTERAAKETNRLDDLLLNLRETSKLAIFDDHAFRLEPEEFWDKNHVNERGRRKFTSQIVDLMIQSCR